MGDTELLVCLFTTILGIVVTVNYWKAFLHQFPATTNRSCKTIFDFADCLVYELLNKQQQKQVLF